MMNEDISNNGNLSGFEQFCGSEFWNLTLTWYDPRGPLFTSCFERSVLQWIPSAWLMLCLIPYTVYLLRLPKCKQAGKKLSMAKVAMSAKLAMLAAAVIVRALTINPKFPTTVIATAAVQLVSYLIACILLRLEHKRAVVASGVLFMYWLLGLLCNVEPLYARFLLGFDQQDIVLNVVLCCSCAVQFVAIVLNCIPDAPPVGRIDGRLPCPETRASFLQRVTFWWMMRTLYNGYKRTLEEPDLFALNPRDKTGSSVPKFQRVWNYECERIRQKLRRTVPVDAGNNRPAASSNERTPLLSSPVADVQRAPAAGDAAAAAVSPSLVKVIAKVFGPRLLFAWFLKICYDFLQFVNPSLIQYVIEYVQDDTVVAWKGYIYAVAFFCSSFLGSCFFHQMFHFGMTTGMQVKATIIAAVYRKSLLLSSAGKRDSTVGEIVNLMSVDAQRMQDVISYLWMMISAPVQILLATTLLWQQLGVSVLAGVAVMVLLIPINGFLAQLQRNLQLQLMKFKDERIKLLNEVFNGIKVLKLYAWELSFQQRVEQIREKELQTLKKAAYLSSVGTFTFTCAPFLVTLTSFATYTLTGNVLDSAKAFTSLSLFNILRFPIALLPMMVSYVITASVSVKRITKFLISEELDPNQIQREQYRAGSARVQVRSADFAWQSDAPATLTNINLDIADGSLTAIVGTVGTGKSSLVAGLLGDMLKQKGNVAIRGSVALVAQQAWIQNLSLKDNITFVSDLDESRYNRVIDACALRPDLEILPAGDRTEIGEKGINLSGGQKQRVALARAAYQEADIYILDDPLSAVDSHVGKQIFDEVIGPNGLLAGKTRLFVTNGVQWLPYVDNIIVLSGGTVSEQGNYNELLARNGPFASFLKQYSQQEEEEVEEEEEAEAEAEAAIIEEQEENEDLLAQVEISATSPTQGQTKSRQMSECSDTRSAAARSGAARRISTCSKRRLSRVSSRQREAELVAEEAKKKQAERLVQEERSEEGNIKLAVFIAYFRSMNLLLVILFFLMFILFQLSSVYSNIWLANWTSDKLLNNKSIMSNSTEYKNTRDKYLGIYGATGAAQAIFVLLYALVGAIAFIISSRTLHAGMLTNILRAPMSFFDTTPVGRIVNRFSRDVETIDSLLPQMFRSWMNTFFNVISTLAVISYSTPAFASVIIPLGILYFVVQRFFIRTSRQLKRLESTTRSPIYTHFSETVTGSQTIRAFGVTQNFIRESERRVDTNQIFYFAGISANRWLGFHLEFCGGLAVFAATIFAVVSRGSIDAAFVGLSVSYALQVTGSLNWMVRMSSDLETNIVSVERLQEYANVDTEAAWDIQQTKPSDDWPAAGGVTLRDLAVRYRDGLELVLHGITCDIQPGEKVGVVGRTGAGKSSLTLSLFRIVEAARGSISIDGLMIDRLGLHQLRSKLTILPQDPVIFSGTLRDNLDPFTEKSDAQLWTALELAHLKDFVSGLQDGLQFRCGEEGSNLSVGQRQLLCLARTLLRKSKILILDEATAAVDLETDSLIQATIRKEFSDATVITIAHRLNTILDSDRVMVLDRGLIREYESPQSLLSRPQSIFYAMAKDAKLV